MVDLCGLSHPSSKEPLDGWGTKFHPLWVGEAGGRLIKSQNAAPAPSPLRAKSASSRPWHFDPPASAIDLKWLVFRELWWALQDSNLRLPPCESARIRFFND